MEIKILSYKNPVQRFNSLYTGLLQAKGSHRHCTLFVVHCTFKCLTSEGPWL